MWIDSLDLVHIDGGTRIPVDTRENLKGTRKKFNSGKKLNLIISKWFAMYVMFDILLLFNIKIVLGRGIWSRGEGSQIHLIFKLFFRCLSIDKVTY